MQHFWPGRGLRAVYATVITMNVIIGSGLADSFLLSHTQKSFRDTGALNGRLSIWPPARQVLMDHLGLGAGVGTFPKLNPMGIAAHTAILDMGAGLGVVGLAVFVAIIVTSLVTGTRATQQGKRTLLVGAFMVTSAPILLSGYWIESPAFWMALGMFSQMAVFMPARGTSPPGDGSPALNTVSRSPLAVDDLR